MNGMDKEHEKIIRGVVIKTLKFLDSELPKSEKYNHPNMALNVLNGAIVHIVSSFLPKEDYEKFMTSLSEYFKMNLNQN